MAARDGIEPATAIIDLILRKALAILESGSGTVGGT
jgi:hypothetical protein